MSDNKSPLELKVIALQNTFATIQCLQKLLDDQVDKLWKQVGALARDSAVGTVSLQFEKELARLDLPAAIEELRIGCEIDPPVGIDRLRRLSKIVDSFVEDQNNRGWYVFNG